MQACAKWIDLHGTILLQAGERNILQIIISAIEQILCGITYQEIIKCNLSGLKRKWGRHRWNRSWGLTWRWQYQGISQTFRMMSTCLISPESRIGRLVLMLLACSHVSFVFQKLCSFLRKYEQHPSPRKILFFFKPDVTYFFFSSVNFLGIISLLIIFILLFWFNSWFGTSIAALGTFPWELHLPIQHKGINNCTGNGDGYTWVINNHT